jgi:hypothetical protein
MVQIKLVPTLERCSIIIACAIRLLLLSLVVLLMGCWVLLQVS